MVARPFAIKGLRWAMPLAASVAYNVLPDAVTFITPGNRR